MRSARKSKRPITIGRIGMWMCAVFVFLFAMGPFYIMWGSHIWAFADYVQAPDDLQIMGYSNYKIYWDERRRLERIDKRLNEMQVGEFREKHIKAMAQEDHDRENTSYITSP